MSSLLALLAAWTTEKRLDQRVLVNESFADAFFRYLEETYGCGSLASHVAHACLLAFDEYVVSLSTPSSFSNRHKNNRASHSKEFYWRL